MLLKKLVTVTGQIDKAAIARGVLNKISCCHWMKLKKHSNTVVFSKIDAVIDQIGKRGTIQGIFSGTLEVVVY